ncbi:MAG: serpin family protein, partial [Deltaproteobacteria bacterium]|nr:serpin family protein [Deltaproteobacteria bacterium]
MGYKIGGVEVQDESINKTLENLQESHPFFRKWGLADEELSAEAAGLLNPVPDQVVDGDDLAEVNSLIRYEGGRELAPAEFGNLARYAQQLMPDISYRSVEGLHENIPAEYRKFGFEVVMDQGSPFLVTSGRNHRDEPMYFSSIPSDTSRIVSGKPPLFKDISTRTLNDGKLQLTVETNYGEVAQYTLDPHSMMGTYVEVVYSEDGEARPVHSFRVKFYETIIDEGVPMSPESEAADPGAPSEAKKSVASSKPSGPLPTDKLTQAMTESLPKQGNQVVSSYSVLEVLTMLFAGLSDAEYRDVAAKLGLAPDLKEQLAHAASVAKALKRSGQGVTVASANRVYASPNTLTEGYRELVAQYFSPEGATEQS